MGHLNLGKEMRQESKGTSEFAIVPGPGSELKTGRLRQLTLCRTRGSSSPLSYEGDQRLHLNVFILLPV